VAFLTYRSNARVNHGRWLLSLYEKFYEEAHYKPVRALLDYGGPSELDRIRRALENHDNVELEEQVVDYLNFFEFIAQLRELKELTEKEIDGLFQYYVELLLKHDFLAKYIREQGFERLRDDLDARKNRRAAGN